MFKIKKWLGVKIMKAVMPLMRRSTLWLFDWRRQRRLYRLHGFVIRSCIVYKDPDGEYGYISEDQALNVCTERIT